MIRVAKAAVSSGLHRLIHEAATPAAAMTLIEGRR
jgi:hypothetical protein